MKEFEELNCFQGSKCKDTVSTPTKYDKDLRKFGTIEFEPISNTMRLNSSYALKKAKTWNMQSCIDNYR